jgi:pimeloyl-ACP methyl ester carboxylesterase
MARRAEWTLAILGGVLMLAGGTLIRKNRLPVRSLVLNDGCHTPASVMDRPITWIPEGASLRYYAIVIHGLSANRRVMYSVGQRLAEVGMRVYLLDSPGEGDSTGHFSFGDTERCAAEAVGSLARSGQIQLNRTVFVGHSLGGAIAVRLADFFPEAAGTVAISPAPLVLPRHMPPNLLIISAQFDPPQLVKAAHELLNAAGGARGSPEDFRQQRAVEFLGIPLAMHSSVLVDSRSTSAAADWAARSLGIPQRGTMAKLEGLRLLGCVIALAGLLMVFPGAVSLTCWLCRAAPSAGSYGAEPPKVRAGAPSGLGPAAILLRGGVAAVVAAGILMLGVPLHALRLYAADYLASFVVFAGLLLLALLPRAMRADAGIQSRPVLAAIVFGLVAAMAVGAALNWQVFDLWPNAPRWWRFVPLALACWPYFAAEELALGPLRVSNRSRRWGIFLGLRLELFFALALGYYGFGSGEFLPLLIAPALLILSVAQRLGGDALRRRTGSAAAAATFDAILAAWFLATVFPLR